MFKKSIIIVLIQIIGTALGVLSIYIVAGDMPPEIYSLIGVYTVVSAIVLTFTHLGIETVMTREVLYWIANNNETELKKHTTQSLASRFMAFLVLIPFLAIYLEYINVTKYNNEYFVLFCAFSIGALFNALADSMSLMVRAEGGYVFAQVMNTLNATVVKFLGIFIYLKWGSSPYIYFYSLSGVPIALVYLIRVKKNISYKLFSIRETINKIKDSRYLWLKADLDYFKSNADSLLVSALFPASIMGSYSLFKQFERLMINFVDGFFDVLSQNTVRYKGNEEKLTQHEKKIKTVIAGTMGLIFIGMIVYGLNADFFIDLAHLGKYENIKIMIMSVAGVGVLYLTGKFQINAIALFATSKTNLLVGVIVFLGCIVSFGFVIWKATITTMLIQKLFSYLLNSIVAIIIFKKQRKALYTRVNR